jgi:protein TonB
MTTPAELALNRRLPLREAGLWLGAGIVVLVAHASFAYLLRDVGPATEHDAMEQAMEIDLAPLPVSVPEAVQSEAVAQEEPVETVEPVEEAEAIQPEQERAVEAPTETVQEVQPEPEADQPIAEDVEPEPVETKTAETVIDEPEVVEAETVEAVTPEVAIPLPQPRPERQAEEKPEPPKKPVHRKVEVAKQKKVEPPKRRTPPASQASTASRAPDIDPSRWNSAVRAAIARRAGAVRGMQGTVRVSFVVGSSGAIVSASVSGSSGDARLDRAALKMVRSARVPAPPEGLGGSRHAFAIPLTFR